MTRHQREHLRRLPRHERLARLLLLAKDHEINADPCTSERAARGQRSDRIYNALKRVRLESGWAA